MYRSARVRPIEDVIKITARSVERVDELIDGVLEVFRCSITPIRDGGNGSFFTYLTVVGRVEE